MQNLRHMLVGMVILAAVLAVGGAINQPAAVDPTHQETATLAGGCFWGLQETLRQIPGVIRTTVGYTGGTVSNPTYEVVAGGKSGHLEAVEVVFDPARLSYEKLLADFLDSRHPLAQSASASPRSRSTIFYHDEAQRRAAERARAAVGESGKWDSSSVAEIKPAAKFYPAEEFHQYYYQKMAVARACSSGK